MKNIIKPNPKNRSKKINCIIERGEYHGKQD